MSEPGSEANFGVVGGRRRNTIAANSFDCVIGGGNNNSIAADSVVAIIAGGVFNNIGTNSNYSAIGGGFHNNIAVDSAYATIPGGDANSATNYALTAGRRAKANHTGTFVWGDSFDGDVASSAANQFTFRASDGARIFSNAAQSAGVSQRALQTRNRGVGKIIYPGLELVTPRLRSCQYQEPISDPFPAPAPTRVIQASFTWTATA
jgi:hypothetical protein